MSATPSASGPLRGLRTLLTDAQRTLQANRPELLSSATARIFTVLILNPLDATKSRLQATTATSPLALRAARTGSPFAGVIPAVLAHAPGGVLAFVIYARLHEYLSRRPHPRRLPAPIAAACLADAFAALWLAPLEAAKLRVQTGVAPTATAALRAGAPWQGLGAQIIRDVPFRLLHLALYERARKAVAARLGRELGPRDGAAVGAAVGAFVGAVTTPLDVVKTRVMAQRAGPASAYQGWIACARKTVGGEGPRALFRGVAQRSVYMAMSVALFSAAYEVCRRAWDEKKEDVVGMRFSKMRVRVVGYGARERQRPPLFVVAPRV